MMTFRIAIVALSMSAATASAQEPPNPAVPSVPLVVVTGEAVVQRAPDRAYINAAVETRSRNPRDAQRQNADLMTAVTQRLLSAGIAKEAIRTLGYSIHQEVDVVNGRRVPREYLARNGVEIRLDAVERTGEVLDLLVQAGANAVGGVRFDLQDRSAAEREALRLAVADARARADAAASGAGRSIDRVLRIDDSLDVMPPRPLMRMAAMAESVADAGTPVEPGTIEIRAQVRLMAAMK
jgi:uncharacterized protein YggE